MRTTIQIAAILTFMSILGCGSKTAGSADSDSVQDSAYAESVEEKIILDAETQSVFNGMWQNSKAELSIDLDKTNQIGGYNSGDEEGPYGYSFGKIIAHDANSITIDYPVNEEMLFVLTYDKGKQEMKFQAKDKTSGETFDETTFVDPLHKMNYLYADGENRIMSSLDPMTLKKKAKTGERYLYRNIYKDGYRGIYLSDGSEAWMDGGIIGVKEPILLESFPTEWARTAEWNDEGHKIFRTTNLTIYKLGGKKVSVMVENMAPVDDEANLRGMSFGTAYLGTIDGNKIILNKEGDQFEAENGDYDTFESMDKPKTIIYTPSITEGIQFDGDRYRQ